MRFCCRIPILRMPPKPNSELRNSRRRPKPVPERRWSCLVLVFACAGTLVLSGCAGYKLGPTNGLAAGEKSIQVDPFVNQTLEPRLTDAVTSQMRKELQRDGTFRLATHADGDIVMTGVITGYHRHELSLSSRDTLTARDYRLSLTAQVSAKDRG